MNKDIIEVHGEIEYLNEDGTKVHSDICPGDCDFKNVDPKWRKFIHEALDEWIDKSRGTGCFYVEQNGWKRT